MSAVWQKELNEYLSNIERHTASSLYRIKNEFINSRLDFDKKFRKNFLRIITNRVSETCDRFEMETIAEERQMGHGECIELTDMDESDQSTSDSMSESSSDTAASISSSTSTLKFELNKQNDLKNNLSIVGVPQVRDENLRGIFLKLCKLLGARISNGDIKSIRRDSLRSMINVELRDHDVKAHICKCSNGKYLWSDEIIRLPSGMVRSRIYINDQMTYFYKQMWEIGREARKMKLIHTSWITDRGFMVKRTSTSKKQYFLSSQDLNDFIEDIRKMNKKPKKRPIDSASTSFGPRGTKLRRLDHGR